MLRAKKVFVGLFTAILLSPLTATATQVGSFNQILGNVRQLKDGAGPGVIPKPKDGVARRDVIDTRAQSRAEVILLDNSVLTVAPDSHVIVEQYAYQPNRERNIVVKLVSGFLDVVVTKAAPGGEFLVKTPTAIMGIRGSWAKVAVKGNDALFAMMAGTGVIKKTAPPKRAQLDKIGKVAYTLKSSDPTSSDLATIEPEPHEFRLAQASGGGDGVTVLSPGTATTVVNNEVAPPVTMTAVQLRALINASLTFMQSSFVISGNVAQSIASTANNQTSLSSQTAGGTKAAMTQDQAILIAAGIEAKFLTTFRDDTVLTNELVSAIIEALIAEGTQVFQASGANIESAITAVTQAATQGALQAGFSSQQATETITPLATKVALDSGMSSDAANAAVGAGIQAGLQTTQMATSEQDEAPPPPPAVPTGTNSVGGGGSGVASPSS